MDDAKRCLKKKEDSLGYSFLSAGKKRNEKMDGEHIITFIDNQPRPSDPSKTYNSRDLKVIRDAIQSDIKIKEDANVFTDRINYGPDQYFQRHFNKSDMTKELRDSLLTFDGPLDKSRASEKKILDTQYDKFVEAQASEYKDVAFKTALEKLMRAVPKSGIYIEYMSSRQGESRADSIKKMFERVDSEYVTKVVGGGTEPEDDALRTRLVIAYALLYIIRIELPYIMMAPITTYSGVAEDKSSVSVEFGMDNLDGLRNLAISYALLNTSAGDEPPKEEFLKGLPELKKGENRYKKFLADLSTPIISRVEALLAAGYFGVTAALRLSAKQREIMSGVIFGLWARYFMPYPAKEYAQDVLNTTAILENRSNTDVYDKYIAGPILGKFRMPFIERFTEEEKVELSPVKKDVEEPSEGLAQLKQSPQSSPEMSPSTSPSSSRPASPSLSRSHSPSPPPSRSPSPSPPPSPRPIVSQIDPNDYIGILVRRDPIPLLSSRDDGVLLKQFISELTEDPPRLSREAFDFALYYVLGIGMYAGPSNALQLGYTPAREWQHAPSDLVVSRFDWFAPLDRTVAITPAAVLTIDANDEAIITIGSTAHRSFAATMSSPYSRVGLGDETLFRSLIFVISYIYACASNSVTQFGQNSQPPELWGLPSALRPWKNKFPNGSDYIISRICSCATRNMSLVARDLDNDLKVDSLTKRVNDYLKGQK
jgi:hypothetical protein